MILYDDKGGFHAARLFWMLDYLGHNKVSILNGGIQRWEADGYKLTREKVNVRPAQFTPTVRARRIASADWLLERRDNPSVVVIDVRPPALFQKGHIPWAHSIPWAQNLKPDNTMKSADELLAHFAAHGVTPDKNIASHCQEARHRPIPTSPCGCSASRASAATTGPGLNGAPTPTCLRPCPGSDERERPHGGRCALHAAFAAMMAPHQKVDVHGHAGLATASIGKSLRMG